MPARIIDLHTHSTASDGTDSPAALAALAVRAGLSAFALTDHDTLAGIEESAASAARLGITFVPGIEIAVADLCGELHLLGLWMPPPSSAMQQALARFKQNRLERNTAMLENLTGLGMPLDLEEVRRLSCAGAQALGRPHIAVALLKKGYITTIKEAFDRFIGFGRAAYVPRKLFSPEEGITLLANEGATVVLAHPCLERNMTAERLDGLLAAFKTWGLAAVEAYHSAHNHKEIRFCVDLADKYGLFLSGGSDYHGANKFGVELGRGAGGFRVPYSLLDKMMAFRADASHGQTSPRPAAGQTPSLAKLWQASNPQTLEESFAFWEGRADEFNAITHQKNKNERRSLVAYLEERGALQSGFSVLDIGCGAGRHALEFGPLVKLVTGIDISPKMIDHARRNSAEAGLENTEFAVTPWQTIDIDALGWQRRFDFVFASMSPAIDSEETLLKMNAASRGFCFMSGFIKRSDLLLRELLRRMAPDLDFHPHMGNIIYAFNLLWERGIYADVTCMDNNWTNDWDLPTAMAAYSKDIKRRLPERDDLDAAIEKELRGLAVAGRLTRSMSSKVAWLFWKADPNIAASQGSADY